MFQRMRYAFADWRCRVWFRKMTNAWNQENYDYYRIARENTNRWARRALRYAQV